MKKNNLSLKNFKIFVIDDDEFYAKMLVYNFERDNTNDVSVFHNGRDCVNKLDEQPNLICLDYSLPDLKCEHIIMSIEKHCPLARIIIVSGQQDIETATRLALRESVFNYLVKNDTTTSSLWKNMLEIKNTYYLENENLYLRNEIEKKYNFKNTIIGQSKAIEDLFNLMNKAVDSDISVSIRGETGTGKELVAKAIHYNSKRRKGHFVSINVGAIPKNLIESELFGHEKGSFTGAIDSRQGKFEEANKGTIFLDEIGEMDLDMQTKLLRVLQEREIVRIGSNKKIKIDIRLLTATHKNLSLEVGKGNFRKDLYYRLMGIPIKLPPLRDRNTDILILSKTFISDFCKKNKRPIKPLSESAITKLMHYNYPGNVRELKAIIELAVIMSEQEEIIHSDIIFEDFNSSENFLKKEVTLDSYIEDIIRHFLENNNNNAIMVSKKLGVAKSTIYRMIKKYNIKI